MKSLKKADNSGTDIKPLSRGRSQAHCKVKTKYLPTQCV